MKLLDKIKLFFVRDKTPSKKLDLKIVLNRIRTPDGTILTSYNRHDFKTHKDANGKTYGVDGGIDYLRRIGDVDDCEELSVYNHEPFEIIRKSFHWGTRGIKGDQPLTYKPVCDLTKLHIKAILKTQTQIPKWVENIFERELKYRDEKNS